MFVPYDSQIHLNLVVSRHSKKALNKATLWGEKQCVRSKAAEPPWIVEDSIQQQTLVGFYMDM